MEVTVFLQITVGAVMCRAIRQLYPSDAKRAHGSGIDTGFGLSSIIIYPQRWQVGHCILAFAKNKAVMREKVSPTMHLRSCHAATIGRKTKLDAESVGSTIAVHR